MWETQGDGTEMKSGLNRNRSDSQKEWEDRVISGRSPEELECLVTQLFWLQDMMVQVGQTEDVPNTHAVAVHSVARILETQWCGLLLLVDGELEQVAFEGESGQGGVRRLKKPCQALVRLFEPDADVVSLQDAEAKEQIQSIWPGMAVDCLFAASIRCNHHPKSLLLSGGEEEPSALEVTMILLSALANSLAVAFDRAKLYERVAQWAVTDGLTGAANYRMHRDVLDRLILRSGETGRPFSLLLVDVDSFKEYNDINGHPAGDQALIELTRVMQGCLDRTDLLARCGGEEFAILLPGRDLEEAYETAEALRAAVEVHRFPEEEAISSERLTVSVGVACCPLHDSSADGLTDKADKALYRAKWMGKNLVQTWESK